MSPTTASHHHVELHGDRQAQCTCCGALFNTDNLFDRHRAGSYDKPGKKGNRRCKTAEQMTAHGWSLNARGFWVGKAPSPLALARRDAQKAA